MDDSGKSQAARLLRKALRGDTVQEIVDSMTPEEIEAEFHRIMQPSPEWHEFLERWERLTAAQQENLSRRMGADPALTGDRLDAEVSALLGEAHGV